MFILISECVLEGQASVGDFSGSKEDGRCHFPLLLPSIIHVHLRGLVQCQHSRSNLLIPQVLLPQVPSPRGPTQTLLTLHTCPHILCGSVPSKPGGLSTGDCSFPPAKDLPANLSKTSGSTPTHFADPHPQILSWPVHIQNNQRPGSVQAVLPKVRTTPK